ncbi:MAG: sulfurase [Gammaproteobacteria bacterium]|nr:MAG: sulfurase [Gammaproteobacteria bacterium]
MPILNPTGQQARIEFLAVVSGEKGIASTAVDSLTLDFGGIVGDTHYGSTRASCARVQRQYPKGTEIHNCRQLSVLSLEEIEQIRQAMDIAELDPTWLGASLVISGIPDFTHVPPASRLIAENGTAIVIDMENAPCRFPGLVIEERFPGKGARFPREALGRRGVTCYVERPGTLVKGDTLQLHCPPKNNWQGWP